MKWQIKKLGEVCEIVNGSTPLRTNKDFWEDGNFPWFTIDDIRTQGRVITTTKQKVTEAALSKLKVLPIDTVLLCCTASVGEYAITKVELTTNQQFNGLIVKDKDQLHPEFLMYYCSTLKDKLLALSGKTTIDFIAISKIKNLKIPLPPLPEQKWIVAILDEAFEAIARAKENTEQNLKNAKEIFESYLQGIFENKGEDWEEKKLGEVCELSAGGDVPKDNFSKNKTEKYTIPIYANGEKREGLYGYTNIVKVQKPSITVSARGTIGFAVKRSEPFYPVVRLIVITPKDNSYLSLDFLHYILKKIDFKHSGTSIPQLTVPMIKDYKIPLPPLPEQQAIVHQLDTLQAETQKLEEIYAQKLNDLEELKKSLLQKAFAGELVK